MMKELGGPPLIVLEVPWSSWPSAGPFKFPHFVLELPFPKASPTGHGKSSKETEQQPAPETPSPGGVGVGRAPPPTF